jgi:predicted dienelactone hydrolase
MRSIIASCVIFLALAASQATAQEPYAYEANCRSWPAVEGKYSVGTVEFEVTDRLRSAQYAPVPTDHRRLYVRAWYPAESVAGLEPRPYLTEAEATVLPGTMLPVFQQPSDALRGCSTLASNGHEGVNPAPGPFPVVGFNHGYLSYPAQQTALFEHLAANGYVVLSVGHPYESGGLVYPNGDAVTMSPRILQDLGALITSTSGTVVSFGAHIADRLAATPEYLRRLRNSSLGQLAAVWQSDVYFVLDRLEEMAVPASVAGVAGVIDHTSRAYMGMSYGGYIAGMLAQGDRRAKAAVNLDGGSWTYELIDTDLRTPFLMLNSDPTAALSSISQQEGIYRGAWGPKGPTAGDLAYERLATAGTRDDIHRIMIPGIEHMGVTDLTEVFRAPTSAPLLGEPGIVSKFTGIQNDLVLGFFDRYVKDIDSDYPKGVLERYPELMIRDRDDIRRQANERGS